MKYIFLQPGDQYYHNAYCETVTATSGIKGYKNTDYIAKNYKDKYFYLRDHTQNTDSELACYDCIVGSNKTTSEINSNLEEPYCIALARERYVQNKNVQYVNGELRDDLKTVTIRYVRNRRNGRRFSRNI